MGELERQLFELSIKFEIAEKACQPVIELAAQIATLQSQIAQAKAAPGPTQLPHTMAHANEWAILQAPPLNREANGDILWA